MQDSMGVFGWLAGQPTHGITVYVMSEQYFSLTTISRISIFQSCRTGPMILFLSKVKKVKGQKQAWFQRSSA